MSTMRWHAVIFKCPLCKVEVMPMKVLASADGTLVLKGICPPCGTQVQVEINLVTILATCVEEDILASMNLDLAA